MDKIEEVLTKTVANIIPSKEKLEKELRSGKKLNVYFGIDPTSTRIHLGNAVPLRKLQSFVELGHSVTFLIGDFTALIGDTSDKDSERPVLSYEQIEENFQTYKQQASKILNFSKIKIRYNSEWLKKLNFGDIIKLTRNFSLNDFISRELIKKRLSDGRSVSLPEVLYPVMQGYDSYFMDTDIQIGGTDQVFNMQAGRTLQKRLRNKESFIVETAFPLEGTDGRKMSKSWGNAIWLDDTPTEMYGKVMSLKDELIVKYFEMATNETPEHTRQIERDLKAGKSPMEIKKLLAYTIVRELHGKEKAQKAQEEFERTFQSRKFSEKAARLAGAGTLAETIARIPEIGSKSEAKRLIRAGGVDVDSKTASDPNLRVKRGQKIKVGKRIFVEIS